MDALQFLWGDTASLAITLFFIMDPIGNTPIFHSVLKEFSPKARMKIIIRELLIALAILLMFLYGGTAILQFLGLSTPALNVAGGILLFLIAIRMVFPVKTLEYGDEPEPDPFIVPLAMPLVAGPSTIAVLMLQATSAPDKMFQWTLALLVAWGMGTVILVASPLLLRVLGQRGLRAMERLMGMLLILISVQLFLDGITDYIKHL